MKSVSFILKNPGLVLCLLIVSMCSYRLGTFTQQQSAKNRFFTYRQTLSKKSPLTWIYEKEIIKKI